MENIVDALELSNVWFMYGVGCLYQEELKLHSLRFLINRADSVLSPSFPFRYQIGGLRDCDLREVLSCEELLVQDESPVSNFVNCKKDHCNVATSDERVQTLFKSCVRWSSMSVEQIRTIAAEEILEPQILYPCLLKPQTATPRVSEPAQPRNLRLQDANSLL